jgi:protein gp37
MFEWLDRFGWNLDGIAQNGRIKSRTFAETCQRLDRDARKSGRRATLFPSLCDWLDDGVHGEWLGEMLRVMEECSHVIFLLLTKRPELFRVRMNAVLQCLHADPRGRAVAVRWMDGIPLHNVWVGVSAENQEMLDRRLSALLDIPAEHHFLSLEPLLEAMDLRLVDARRWVHWVIVGGESGAKARPCDVGWIGDIIEQCRRAALPCFVKQLGSRPIGVAKLMHYQGGEMSEWPEEVRVREWPDGLEAHHGLRQEERRNAKEKEEIEKRYEKYKSKKS